MQDEFTTPCQKDFDFPFFIKREDLQKTGSHKCRALFYQLKKLREEGVGRAVISTSGNAGITASALAASFGIEIIVLMSERSPIEKLEEVYRLNPDNLYISTRASRLANYIGAKHKLPNLKPTIDTNAAIGFESLGQEIAEQLPEVEEVYTFATSGASYVGTFQAFEKLIASGSLARVPRMHVVTGSAGSLGATRTPYKKDIEKILETTAGKTFDISEDELQKFKDDHPNIVLSDESMSSLAAAVKNSAGEKSVVVSTGKKWNVQNPNFNISQIKTLNSFEECDSLF